MAQFDFSTLFSVLFTFLVSWCLFYSFISLHLLPEIVSIAKFRVKKLEKSLILNNLNYIAYFLSTSLK